MQKWHQPIWGIINGQKPDLLLLLGDNVYMGEGEFNEDRLEESYQMQLAEPHFSKLLCEVPYLATWDNHDYGRNQVETPGQQLTDEQKVKTRSLFDKYLKKRSLLPDTEHVYCSYNYTKGNENVRIIMLDVRSFQEDPRKGHDPAATLLGQTQEDWLLEEMRTSTGITIICSGFAFSFGNKMNWKMHKNWSDRFIKAAAHTSKPLFLAGNNHTNEFKGHVVSEEPVTRFPPATNPLIHGEEVVESVPARKRFFYEAVSSGVGRNHDRDDDEDYVINDLYAGRPHNKYGIINITPAEVEIVLYSQKPNKFYHRMINANTWSLKE